MAAGYLQNKRKNRERGEGKGLVHLAPIHRSFELLTGVAARKMRKNEGGRWLLVVFGAWWVEQWWFVVREKRLFGGCFSWLWGRGKIELRDLGIGG
ncbi:hypothetical protein KY285_001424 [Solanum tuberosum]|nr:hypothetical protein KY285_001424 [Solanum tuberosum]